MNCCDDYGQCKQGHGCPARETKMTHTTESLMELADAYGKLLAYYATDDYMVCDDGKTRFALQSAITELVAERDALAARVAGLEAVAVVKNHNLQPVILRRELPDGTELYLRPLPAQDVNAELVRVLERIAQSKLCPVGSPTLMVEQIQQLARTALANAKAAQQKGGV